MAAHSAITVRIESAMAAALQAQHTVTPSAFFLLNPTGLAVCFEESIRGSVSEIAVVLCADLLLTPGGIRRPLVDLVVGILITSSPDAPESTTMPRNIPDMATLPQSGALSTPSHGVWCRL